MRRIETVGRRVLIGGRTFILFEREGDQTILCRHRTLILDKLASPLIKVYRSKRDSLYAAYF